MESTTLMTFMLQCSQSVRTVELLGSWDNFSSPYNMKRDRRKGLGHWTGCYRFKNIICDGDIEHLTNKREGGLLMGGIYWFYYRLDGEIEYSDPSYPVTTLCPLLPGQQLNVLEVPTDSTAIAPASNDQIIVPSLNPEDKYQTPHPKEALRLPKVSKRTAAGVTLPQTSPRLVRCRSAGTNLGYRRVTREYPVRRARSASDSPVVAAHNGIIPMRGYSPDTDTGRGRSRARQLPVSDEDSHINPFLLSTEDGRLHMCSPSSSTTPSQWSQSSVSTSRHGLHVSSRAVSPDLERIGEVIGEEEEQLIYDYNPTAGHDTEDLYLHDGLVFPSRSNSQQSVASSRLRQDFSGLFSHRRSTSNDSTNNTSPTRHPTAYNDLVDIPEDVNEGNYEDIISEQELREFSPSGMEYTYPYPTRPPSRRASPEGDVHLLNILDKDVPMLAPLPEEVDETLPDFHFQLRSDGDEGDVLPSSESSSSLDVWGRNNSVTWEMPVFVNEPLLSPTFSSLSEYSSGIHTPDLGARLERFFQPDAELLGDDEELGFDRLVLDNNGPLCSTPFQLRDPPPGSAKVSSSPNVVHGSTLYGYSLMGHPDNSEATLTRFELEPSKPFESFTPQASRPPTAHQQKSGLHAEASQISQLVDDFAYLGEAVT
ncbi:hypothetical protein EJ05DRAFT_56582 [Pseudovirgaria hyperparasitica]|uniref:Uncharacterized protein n=1 Tax=Pseudovirgaria hyperparasitica TaxID=470096 RepID=A0A6A6W5C3_9PEZI|nr:uncharacterized protein EJ05DRAFT_56582 [Pseudovirgaria hyperparasitica]KAF2757130.1 hypothetical protein EJ05DRAFT_56582 [Pseudovirgaria hyperparasitica]